MDVYRDTGTRSSSDSSGLTGHESDDFTQQDSPVTESMSTEWTDEKHNLYLKSMEASFVDQLHSSMDLLGQSSQKDLSVPNFQLVKCEMVGTPSGQFKVLRRGNWQKIHFRKAESQTNLSNESHGFLASPWIQHFRSSRKPQVVASPALLERAPSVFGEINLSGQEVIFSGSASCSKHSHPLNPFSRHHDLVNSKTEMSDQNFIDEDDKDGKATTVCSSKRKRTQPTDASSGDQVVPHSGPSATKDVAEKSNSSSPRQQFTSVCDRNK